MVTIAPITIHAASCGELDGNGNKIVCGNGSPENVVNGYGVKNSDVPHVAPGQSVSDAAGISSTCPAWFGVQMYCVDIYGTDVYKNAARATARQLQSGGFALGLYSYWLKN